MHVTTKNVTEMEDMSYQVTVPTIFTHHEFLFQAIYKSQITEYIQLYRVHIHTDIQRFHCYL